MLAIRKRLPFPKLVTSGMIAFTIGLTASAAYLSTTIERMPYNFSALQKASDSKTNDPNAKGVNKEAKDQSTANSANVSVGSSQPSTSTSAWAPYVAPETQPRSAGSSAPSQSPVATGSATAPVQTIIEPTPQQPQPAPVGGGVLQPILQPVTDTLDDTVQIKLP